MAKRKWAKGQTMICTEKPRLSNKTQEAAEGEFTCYRKVPSSCSTSRTRRVTIVTNPVICLEWEKDGIVTQAPVVDVFILFCCVFWCYREFTNCPVMLDIQNARGKQKYSQKSGQKLYLVFLKYKDKTNFRNHNPDPCHFNRYYPCQNVDDYTPILTDNPQILLTMDT
jgi:hypothetical protein